MASQQSAHCSIRFERNWSSSSNELQRSYLIVSSETAGKVSSFNLDIVICPSVDKDDGD